MNALTPAQYRASRLQLGLTQAGLAALLGIDCMTVSRRERGLVPISAEAALALRALRTPAETDSGSPAQP